MHLHPQHCGRYIGTCTQLARTLRLDTGTQLCTANLVRAVQYERFRCCSVPSARQGSPNPLRIGVCSVHFTYLPTLTAVQNLVRYSTPVGRPAGTKPTKSIRHPTDVARRSRVQTTLSSLQNSVSETTARNALHGSAFVSRRALPPRPLAAPSTTSSHRAPPGKGHRLLEKARHSMRPQLHSSTWTQASPIPC